MSKSDTPVENSFDRPRCEQLVPKSFGYEDVKNSLQNSEQREQQQQANANPLNTIYNFNNFLHVLLSAPDGVKPPRVESDTPYSMAVFWDPVGRANAIEEVAYLLQFRQNEGDVIEE
jgi:hypothetical protein